MSQGPKFSNFIIIFSCISVGLAVLAPQIVNANEQFSALNCHLILNSSAIKEMAKTLGNPGLPMERRVKVQELLDETGIVRLNGSAAKLPVEQQLQSLSIAVQQLAPLPLEVFRLMVEQGKWQMELVLGDVTDHPGLSDRHDLKGRGGFSTSFHTLGGYIHRIIVAIDRQAHYMSFDGYSTNLTLHEYAHAFDVAFEAKYGYRLSASTEFLEAMTKTDWRIALDQRFFQNDSKECFADMFARHFTRDLELVFSHEYPHIKKFFDEHPLTRNGFLEI